MQTFVDRHLKVPKYLQLADYLRLEIDSGNLGPDERLPSFNEMKAKFDATQRTVEKAHTLLESDGLIRREPGRGVFVNDLTKRAITDFIGLLDYKPTRQFPYFMEVQRGIREQVQAYGKSITMIDEPYDFKHWKLMDGILLERTGYFQSFDAVEDFPKNMPVVRLYYPEAGISSVMADDAAGIEQAVEHLLGLGHKRIGYLINLKPYDDALPALPPHPIIDTRYQAYLETLKANGIVPDDSWVSQNDPENYGDMRDFGYHVMRKWLNNGWRELGLTAMLAQNDSAAIGMIRALEEENIRVPDDVSVVGFDGLDISDYDSVQLTTVVTPLCEIGATAMRVLNDHINQPNRPCEIVKLPVQLHVGESTAPLNHS